MKEPTHKKIMTISLSHSQRAKAYGIFDGNILVVTHIEPIAGLFAFWEKPIRSEIGQGKKPVVLVSGAIRERVYAEGLPIVLINNNIMALTSEDELLI